MELKRQMKDKVVLFDLKGRLDVKSSERLHDEVVGTIKPNCKVILNMKNCEYVTSAGLRTLLYIANQIKQSGGNGVLAGVTPEVLDIMKITGFDAILKNYECVETAINALKEGE